MPVSDCDIPLLASVSETCMKLLDAEYEVTSRTDFAQKCIFQKGSSATSRRFQPSLWESRELPSSEQPAYKAWRWTSRVSLILPLILLAPRQSNDEPQRAPSPPSGPGLLCRGAGQPAARCQCQGPLPLLLGWLRTRVWARVWARLRALWHPCLPSFRIICKDWEIEFFFNFLMDVFSKIIFLPLSRQWVNLRRNRNPLCQKILRILTL
nr:uncharacterized protein LOC113805249 [Penaeus vannamei]